MGDEQLKSSPQKMSWLQNATPSIYEAATIASTCGCTSKLNSPNKNCTNHTYNTEVSAFFVFGNLSSYQLNILLFHENYRLISHTNRSKFI